MDTPVLWPVWTTSFERPLFGVKLEVILSWLPQYLPLRRQVQHLFNTAFLQSFILHDRDWPVLSSTNSESRSKVPTCALVTAVEVEGEQPLC